MSDSLTQFFPFSGAQEGTFFRYTDLGKEEILSPGADMTPVFGEQN
jgi:hypothetical protein